MPGGRTPVEAPWGSEQRLKAILRGRPERGPRWNEAEEEMEPEKIIATLPKLEDGTPAYLGQIVEREFKDHRWVAEVVGLSKDCLDVEYTEDCPQRGKGCVSRGVYSRHWRPLGSSN